MSRTVRTGLCLGLLTLAVPLGSAQRVGHVVNRRGSSLAPTSLTTLDLTQGVTPQDLVNLLVGPVGITTSNVTFTGAPVAAGKFQGGTGIIGFEGGVILSSGCVSSIPGPNVSDSVTCDNTSPGDPDLDVLSGYPTFDAAVLEFDFVPTDPTHSTLLFSYVFSSDEYNEWVYTPYNDVFAFFVNGQNCALVPGPTVTPAPVSIDTVNNGNPFGSTNASNPLLYRNNALPEGGGSINTEMDGLTVVLTCQATITPNVTNHMKLSIADSSDAIYDSNVMIKAGSLASTDLVITLSPPSATNLVGTTHTVTAFVFDGIGVPQPGREIGFEVISGPNDGSVGTCAINPDCTTDATGRVSWTYTGGPTPGTDVIRACFDDVGGNLNCSAAVTKTWVLPCGPDGTPCDDADPCTVDDACSANFCVGAPAPAPPEVDDHITVTQVGGSSEISWNIALGATSSDVVRGLASMLPVGPGGDDETCMGTFPEPTAVTADIDIPPTGDAFWYLVRGANACGNGPWGHQVTYGSPPIPRLTTTCP